MHKLLITSYFFLLVSTFAVADIVFVSNRDGKNNIYMMNDNGSRVQRLTDTPLSLGGPRWSPDGSQIAFHMDLHSTDPRKPQQIDIFIMNTDGSDQQRLTDHPKLDTSPSWSPDGKYLTFNSGRSGKAEIYTMEIATGKIKQLTQTDAPDDFAANPEWSPDGTQIVYEYSKAGHGRHIYIMDVDGRNAQPLLKKPRGGIWGGVLLSFGPSWSPDGKHILYSNAEFVAGQGRVADSIFIVDRDSRQLQVLNTPKRWRIEGVRWTDDGEAVLFPGIPRGLDDFGLQIFKIYKYHLHSGQITNLTDHPSDNWDMDWTPHNYLPVSSRKKLTIQWARLKTVRSNPFMPSSP